MIITLLLYLISFFIAAIGAILPAWTIWPANLLSGLTYFCSSLASVNFIFPIDSLFTIILFIINFEVLYLTAKIILKIFNYARGTGSGLDI